MGRGELRRVGEVYEPVGSWLRVAVLNRRYDAEYGRHPKLVTHPTIFTFPRDPDG